MKKEITLVIPISILVSKQLSDADKLVFGLHYAYFKKGKATFETNIEIGKRLLLHVNTVSKSNTLFEENQLLKRENSSYKVVEEILETLERPNFILSTFCLQFQLNINNAA